MKTAKEAYDSGRANAHTAPLHDLTGHMARIAIPPMLQAYWLHGVEDALSEGFDTEEDIEEGT